MSPKLSDALRGMADRAPVGEFSVSSADAARRVRRHRTLRATANSLVGASAVAVLAFAIVAPNLGGASADLAAGNAQDTALPEIGMADAVAGDRRMAYCGAVYSPTATTQPATLDLEFPGSESEAGVPQVTVIRTGTADFAGEAEALTIYVLWEGIVVGYSSPGDGLGSVTWSESDTTFHTVDLDKVNCWDGAALPQGEYALVATQVLYPDSVEVIIGADAGGGRDVPAAEPSMGSDTPVTDVPDGDVAVAYQAPEMLVSAQLPTFIDGAVVEDPFGEYLTFGDGDIHGNLPEDYLMPAIARDLYAAHLTSARWDMAPGTQRVVMANTEDNYFGTLFSANFFGCSWDGTQPALFPTQSAQWDLLGVTGSIPAAINVSYGYVVDSNPEITLAVSNNSGYTLPAMYQPDSTLMLVKDGVVVAQSYGTPTSRTPRYETSQYLNPDSTVRQTFLWRDVDGCWRGGSQQAIEPGTYTVVNLQSVYLTTSSVVYYMDGFEGTSESAQMYDLGGTHLAIEGEVPQTIAVDPGYSGMNDFVELHVWTSLGTVTVTTR